MNSHLKDFASNSPMKTSKISSLSVGELRFRKSKDEKGIMWTQCCVFGWQVMALYRHSSPHNSTSCLFSGILVKKSLSMLFNSHSVPTLYLEIGAGKLTESPKILWKPKKFRKYLDFGFFSGRSQSIRAEITQSKVSKAE